MTRWELAKLAALCFLVALPWAYAAIDVFDLARRRRRG